MLRICNFCCEQSGEAGIYMEVKSLCDNALAICESCVLLCISDDEFYLESCTVMPHNIRGSHVEIGWEQNSSPLFTFYNFDEVDNSDIDAENVVDPISWTI